LQGMQVLSGKKLLLFSNKKPEAVGAAPGLK
jgi:hypothetical protein